MHMRTNTHISAIRTNALQTFQPYNSTYIGKYTQIHIITHRRRLTHTCAHAHSETHARTLTHTHTNMHTQPHRFETYTQICTYPYFYTKNER